MQLIVVYLKQLGRVAVIFMLFVAFHTENDAMGLELKSRIVFSTQNELEIINLENGRNRKALAKITLPHKLDIAHNPSWMPDGEKVIFEYSPWNAQRGSTKRYLGVAETESKKVYAFTNELIDKKESYMFPEWSPNGDFLAFLDHKETKLIKGNNGTIKNSKYLNRLMIYDKKAKVLDTVDQVFAARSPISWSSDNKMIAFCTSDYEIAVHYLHKNTKVLIEGSYPTFNPATHELYYVGYDKHLYKMRVDGKGRTQIDDDDWSWHRLMSISKDGTKLLFIGGGSFLFTEYSTINVFNIISHEIERLSKKYPIIHGASLFEGT